MQTRALYSATMFSVACLAVTALAPRGTLAAQMIIQETSPQPRNLHADVTATLGFNWVGIAGWFAYPIVPEGFIGSLNDTFDIEAGAFLTYNFNQGARASNYLGLAPLAGARWQFHLTPDWTAFATAKIGVNIGLGYSLFALHGGGSVGAYWKARDDIYVRLEAGYPGGLMAGVGFPL